MLLSSYNNKYVAKVKGQLKGGMFPGLGEAMVKESAVQREIGKVNKTTEF